MEVTCCPLYTIRCFASQFKPSKSQRRVVSRWPVKRQLWKRDLTFLFLTLITINRFHSCLKDGSSDKQSEPESSQHKSKPIAEKPSSDAKLPNTLEENSLKPEATVSDEVKGSKRIEGLKKKKLMRIEKQLAKSKSPKLEPATVQRIPSNQPKTLQDILPSRNYAGLNEVTEQYVGQEDPKHKFQLRLVRASMGDQFFRSTFEESYMVYSNYQQQIHGDPPSECDMRTFAMFLCDSPLLPREENGVVLGAFHQQYIVDGRIVAVGVIDILPSCVSSVYFYYCPTFWGRRLSPGTYSAIR